MLGRRAAQLLMDVRQWSPPVGGRIGRWDRTRSRSAALSKGLDRNPDAPAAWAESRYGSPLNLVTTITGAGGANVRAARITSKPSPSGR